MNFIYLIFLLCFLSHASISASQMLEQRKTSKAIVFQPQFKWADGSQTQQGTGSFIRGPKGKIIGLTSAHFINFSGPQLLEVDWLDIRTQKAVATAALSWGMPGKEGCYKPLDLRSDYLLLVMEGGIYPESILEMDDRRTLKIGERVWFPNKNAETRGGYELIEGTTIEAKNTHLVIKLDKVVNLHTRSGTPIISQVTKKVIGILTGGDGRLLYLAPGFSINKALLTGSQCFLLQNVVGSTPRISWSGAE